MELPLSWHRSPDESPILSQYAVDKKNPCFLDRLSYTVHIPAVNELSQLLICLCRFSVWNKTLWLWRVRMAQWSFPVCVTWAKMRGGGNVSGTSTRYRQGALDSGWMYWPGGKEQWDYQKKSTSDTCVCAPDKGVYGEWRWSCAGSQCTLYRFGSVTVSFADGHVENKKMREQERREIGEVWGRGVSGDKKGGNERKGHLRRKNNTEWEEQKLCRKEADISSIFTLFRLRCCITPPNIDIGMKVVWRWVVAFTLRLHYLRDWTLHGLISTWWTVVKSAIGLLPWSSCVWLRTTPFKYGSVEVEV